MHALYIPDGNKRFSRKKGMSLKEAYQKGGENIARIIKWLNSEGVNEVSLFLFATHNLSRKEEEVLAIAEGAKYAADSYFISDSELMKRRFEVIGTTSSGLVEKVRSPFLKIAQNGQPNSQSRVNFLVGFSGEDEITQALQSKPSSYKELSAQSMISPIDLVIRAGPIVRLSEAPILAIHPYTAFFGIPHLNPEVTEMDIRKIVKEYREHSQYRS